MWLARVRAAGLCRSNGVTACAKLNLCAVWLNLLQAGHQNGKFHRNDFPDYMKVDIEIVAESGAKNSKAADMMPPAKIRDLILWYGPFFVRWDSSLLWANSHPPYCAIRLA